MKEKTSGFLSFLYTTPVGRGLLSILVSPAVSQAAGKVMNSGVSSLAVPGFIKSHDIDVSELEKTSFSSYNDFFTRKLKPGARPFEASNEALISPCDAKLTLYPIMKDSRFWIGYFQITYTIIYKHRLVCENEHQISRKECTCHEKQHRYYTTYSDCKGEYVIERLYILLAPILRSEYCKARCRR